MVVRPSIKEVIQKLPIYLPSLSLSVAGDRWVEYVSENGGEGENGHGVKH